MYISIDLGTDVVSLADLDDFSKFSIVVVNGSRVERVREIVMGRGIGRMADDSGDNVWVAIGWLRRQAEGTVDGAWGQRFDAMIEEAKAGGWVDGSGAHLKVHVTYP